MELDPGTEPQDTDDDVLVQIVIGQEPRPVHGRPIPERRASARSLATTGFDSRSATARLRSQTASWFAR